MWRTGAGLILFHHFCGNILAEVVGTRRAPSSFAPPLTMSLHVTKRKNEAFSNSALRVQLQSTVIFRVLRVWSSLRLPRTPGSSPSFLFYSPPPPKLRHSNSCPLFGYPRDIGVNYLLPLYNPPPPPTLGPRGIRSPREKARSPFPP